MAINIMQIIAKKNSGENISEKELKEVVKWLNYPKAEKEAFLIPIVQESFPDQYKEYLDEYESSVW